MSLSVQLQPAYVLHTRPYRETSLLLEIFTPDYGRISAVARSARGPRSRFKGLLQPFQSLMISWYGKTELMNVTAAESNGIGYYFSGESLICAIYLNELLMRLLHRYDAHPALYTAYQKALSDLQQKTSLQQTLRLFEKCLLLELGYALQLKCEWGNGKNIEPDGFYYFNPTQGLVATVNNTHAPVFSGKNILALQANQLTDEDSLRDAKRLLRIALNHLLENKPIKSRELFFK